MFRGTNGCSNVCPLGLTHQNQIKRTYYIFSNPIFLTMKFKKTIHCFALFTTLFFVQSSFAQPGQTGQKMSISQGRLLRGIYDVTGASSAESGTATTTPLALTNAIPLTFKSLDGTPPSVGNKSCEGVTDGFCGWYEAFWIFGDGNYRNHFEGNTIESDTLSLTVNSYRYAREGLYKPIVFLTEKYHNTKPPEAARASINVTNTGASGRYVELTRRLQGKNDRKLDMDFNHFPRVDYPMNFVLSYRKSEPVAAVLFYYNALASNTFDLFSPTNLFEYNGNEATNYQGTGYEPQREDDLATEASRLAASRAESLSRSGTILDGLASKFKSRLVYNVNDLPGPFPDGMTELRVFPALKSHPLALMPTGLMTDTPTTRFPCFATILVGGDSVPVQDSAFQRLMDNARILFGPINSLQLGPNSKIYIKGIELLNLRMQTSHDPNSLVVINVEDVGNGKFKVTFRLTICNKGQMPEGSPTLYFKDLAFGKYGTKPELSGIGDATPKWSDSAPWSVNLNGFLIPGVPANHAPSCRELTFTMITDAAGVDKLYQDAPRALEVCVNFSLGVGECSQNDVLAKDALQERKEEQNGTIHCGGLLLWLLLAVLAAILLWYLLKGRTM